MKQVAILFARHDSVYKTLPGCNVYDADRNARTWPGGSSIIAHPPCRLWGRLRQFSKAPSDEAFHAIWAVGQVREWGGVLEHPAHSKLWEHLQLAAPGGERDIAGGWTLPIVQQWWGHRAQKKTWLYIVGCDPKDLPPMPMSLADATHCIRPTKSYPRKPSVTKPEREHTPIELAKWLCEVARRCAKPA